MNRQSGAFIGLAAIVSFLLGLVVAGTHPPVARNSAMLRPPVETPLAVERTPLQAGAPVLASGGVDFAPVAARVNAAVVNVDTASRGDDRPRPSHRYSTDDPSAPREGSGSGFVIDAAGFILTNHHVVSGADRVTVTLADGRAFRADIVGSDPAIDVALLHVDSRDPLPVAPIGDSSALRVGEWVCAIGNPLGIYVHSVTVGVVSYLGRTLSIDDGLDTYIQTDAAISFGSSGGPLINARGEVVGITTAISTQALNIGFAVPMAQVTAVLPQLRERGTVARGAFDMGVTTVTPVLRRALHVGPDHGALVQDVVPDTQAERAGLRPYDVVTALNGQDIRSAEELTRLAAALAPGALVTLDVWRDGVSRRLSVKLGVRRVVDPARRQVFRANDARRAAQVDAPLGIRVRDLDADMAMDLRIPDDIRGVLVSEVDTAGPAYLAQVRTSHVILEVNRHPIRSEAEYRAATMPLRPGEPVALLIYERTTRARVIRTVVTDPEP